MSGQQPIQNSVLDVRGRRFAESARKQTLPGLSHLARGSGKASFVGQDLLEEHLRQCGVEQILVNKP